MSSSYFLVFLLGLLILFTATTAETEPTSRPFFGRNMYSRGSVDIKPIEKTREATLMQDEKLKPSVSSTIGKKESMQMGEEKTILEDMNAAAYSKDAKKVEKMVGDSYKPANCGETNMHKLDKESKYYNAGARVSNVHKVEGVNQ